MGSSVNWTHTRKAGKLENRSMEIAKIEMQREKQNEKDRREYPRTMGKLQRVQHIRCDVNFMYQLHLAMGCQVFHQTFVSEKMFWMSLIFKLMDRVN